MGLGLDAPDPFEDLEDPERPRQRFSLDTLARDAPAGVITGLMAVPLTVGICLLSEYPIQLGLLTVIVACVVGFVASLFRPGNYIGVPGVAAGLAPVLALGVHRYGMENMPWIIFLTAASQMLVWRYRLEKYILKAVPPFLIEGLLAGVGLKIAMKFVPYTYETVGHSDVFWSPERIGVVTASAGALLLFYFLYKRFKDTSPGLPYILVIAGSAWLATQVQFPQLHIEPVTITWKPPFPDFAAIPPAVHVEMVLFAMMLSTVDIIEQVMSNAAIEKIDPRGRKTDSNNSLLAIWLANGISSFFGGMTNLDGLAKSSTNRMAGALTKMSCLFVAAVLGAVLAYPEVLTYLPEFSLAVLMIFTGWKMIAGVYHVAHHGKYAFALAMLCGILVFRLGIFEGLLICLALHSFITYVVYRAERLPTVEILKKFLEVFTERKVHPHQTDTLEVVEDAASGGVRYVSVVRPSTAHKNLDDFIKDWEHGINTHNLLAVVGTYDATGLLWGTFAKDLRCGHFHIKRYFEHLFELDGVKVRFDSAETRKYGEIYIRSGSYTFSYRKRGALVQVPARYSFVCKREKTGWYILEHHSSEFPH
ncbi:MAG TPA: SulP family inorganic anion transporter [Nannocystis sp.]